MYDCWAEQEEDVLLYLRRHSMRCPVLTWREHVEPCCEHPPLVDVNDPDYRFVFDAFWTDGRGSLRHRRK